MKWRLLGAVLCGGRSSRMGTDKAMLPHPSGMTYLQHSLARLKPVCDEVVLSTRSLLEGLSLPAPVQVKDSVPGLGPAQGVAACVEYARVGGYDACLFIPVDMPHLTIADLGLLRSCWLDERELPVCALAAADGRLQPLVAIYPVQCLDSIKKLLQSEHRSLRRWLDEHPHRTVTLSLHSCRNVNAPEDLAT